MTAKKLNILVISDLHAHSAEPIASSASYCSTNPLYKSADMNPLSGIPTLLAENSLRVDWVVSPGDLGDKAEPSAQSAAWTELKNIKIGVGATELIATAGNHDIDSRRSFPDFDPKSSLQTLDPAFPIATPAGPPGLAQYSDIFWSRNFVIVPFVEHDCSLVILNSCAFHGYSSDANSPPNEHLRGRISPQTASILKNEIHKLDTKLNILLVHHHLRPHPFINDGASYMLGGEKLVDTLKSSSKQWFVLHGHQHVPYLSYADGTPFAPIILSAGSVAAKTYPAIGGVHPRNQIHHVAIDLDLTDQSGAEVLGHITTWSWSPTVGWKAAKQDAGLPYQSGFGYRPHMIGIRDQIASKVAAAPQGVIKWERIIEQMPKLKFLLTSDISELAKLVETKKIKMPLDPFGMPNYLELS